jgi:hypothetical protein
VLINRDEDALSHSMQSSACRVVSCRVVTCVCDRSESESDESDESDRLKSVIDLRTTSTTIRVCESDVCDMRTLYTDRTHLS